MTATFDEVWARLLREMAEDAEVLNWGQARGFTGGRFRIEMIEPTAITVHGGRMQVARRISKGDFERVYDVWQSYVEGHYSRERLTALSQNTTYILSMLRMLDPPIG